MTTQTNDTPHARGAAFAALIAVLAVAVIGVEVWAFAWGCAFPFWLWLIGVVLASVALVGAVTAFIVELVGTRV